MNGHQIIELMQTIVISMVVALILLLVGWAIVQSIFGGS